MENKQHRFELFQVSRSDDEMLRNMSVHYSHPKGIVGRSICYRIISEGICYGTIAGGSATRFLPGRNEFFGMDIGQLNQVVNNVFFHIERVDGRYPCRWFAPKVLSMYRRRIEEDWKSKYGDTVIGHETLVESPRTGDCYLRDGWILTGRTIGYTCKRVSGNGTDSWTGRRVWDTENLRPKLVFVHNSCRR